MVGSRAAASVLLTKVGYYIKLFISTDFLFASGACAMDGSMEFPEGATLYLKCAAVGRPVFFGGTYILGRALRDCIGCSLATELNALV